jgi:hypothetical protein
LAAHAFRAKTLTDGEVREVLARDFVLAMHNQLPELYCNQSVNPGEDRYPGDQVEGCPESAGGGNLRVFLCRPGGELLFEMLGYWKPERFLAELRRGAAMALADQAGLERLHRECLARHAASPNRAEKMLVRAHEEALADLLKPVDQVLGRIEDEIYTKGSIG